jgi:hypothetical protein
MLGVMKLVPSLTIAAVLGLAASRIVLSETPVSVALPAPGVYATPNYGLTFQVPPNSFYCPLPEGWVGSDHGTLIFLESPGGCGGAGYPSSARGYQLDVARIGMYYGYDVSEPDDEENAPAEVPCDVVTRSRFLGHDTPICKTAEAGRIILRAESKYEADIAAEAAFTLVTTADRYTNDLAVFQALLASAKPCNAEWEDGNGRKAVIGTGDRCPDASWF